MKKINILNKSFSKPISCLTAYSPSVANILDGKIDLILVGDSLGSTLYGMKNTQEVTMDMMKNQGVTPQSYKNFDKIKILGKTIKEKKYLLKLARESEKLGAKAILLECITADTAKLITDNISIPTIGIGASKFCDGQVLVFDDLINLTTNNKKPRFVKNYLNFNRMASDAVKKYNKEVKLKKFPSVKFTYS